MGKGIQVLPPDINRSMADIIPVDYFARILIASAAFMTKPGYKFVLPYNEVLADNDDTESIVIPNIQYFPYIYQLSATGLVSHTTWKNAYEAVRTYWSRNSKQVLPSAEDYFGAGRSLFKSSFFMKYKLPQSLSSAINGKSSDAVSRTIELASRVVESIQPFLRHHWLFDHQNVQHLEQAIAGDSQFDVSKFKDLDWNTYMVNYAYGTHAYISPSPPAGLRNITVADGWSCSLYVLPEKKHPIIDRPIESVIFSASDIEKRTDRMLNELIASLENPNQELKDKKKMEQWVNDFDASLDDWCHDDSDRLKDTKNMGHLGYWLNRPDEEHVRIEVLNDQRVGNCIKQVILSDSIESK